jgi:membrane associated rhomboid family serine protease
VSRYNRSSFGGIGPGGWSPAVRTLIIVCSTAFVLQIFDTIAGGQSSIIGTFGLTPAKVIHNFYIWQLVTYIFLHSGFLHILFNMLGLWMFGTELERYWGTREFTKFFFICGIGAALTTVLVSPNSTIPTIGASGAIYGVLLAYGLLFPNRIIIFIIFPIPAKWFVIILGAMNLFSSVSSGGGGGVAYVAHLGGLAVGFLYLKGGRVFRDFRGHYDRWQRNRLRRKFDVYYNERHRDNRGDKGEEKWRRWKN